MGFVTGRLAVLAAALVVAVPSSTPVALADWRDEIKVLRIGVMTGPNSAYRLAQLEPFRAYLAEKLAVPVEIIPARDYRALIDAQVGSRVHYAIYSATAFAAAAAAEDHSEQKRRLMEQARQQAEARRTAADELRSASGRFDQVRLGTPAMRLLLELLTTALGNARLHRESGDFLLDGARADDADLGIRLTAWRTPGRSTVLRSVDGDLTADDLTVAVESTSTPAAGEMSAAEEPVSALKAPMPEVREASA